MSSEEEGFDEKRCDVCKKKLPFTKEFYPLAKRGGVGLKMTCRDCCKRLARKKKSDEIEKKAFNSFVARVTRGGTNVPHSAELLESLMTNFGGANGFAGLALKQYFDAPEGSRIRSGILEMVSRLTIKNTEQGGARKPVSLYSEEELLEALDERLRHAVVVTGVISDESQASAYSHNPLGLPERRTADAPSGVERTTDGGFEALSSEPPADGLPQGYGERDPGYRG